MPERIGLRWACRIFAALGFSVAAVPRVESEEDVDRVVDVVRRVTIDHLELGYATAQESLNGWSSPLLSAVLLPAAHLWRSRAETSRRIERYERAALAAIAEQAGRGHTSCRLAWSAFASGPPEAPQLQRLADLLRDCRLRVERRSRQASPCVCTGDRRALPTQSPARTSQGYLPPLTVACAGLWSPLQGLGSGGFIDRSALLTCSRSHPPDAFS